MGLSDCITDILPQRRPQGEAKRVLYDYLNANPSLGNISSPASPPRIEILQRPVIYVAKEVASGGLRPHLARSGRSGIAFNLAERTQFQLFVVRPMPSRIRAAQRSRSARLRLENARRS